jgi:hypothetical protein
MEQLPDFAASKRHLFQVRSELSTEFVPVLGLRSIYSRFAVKAARGNCRIQLRDAKESKPVGETSLRAGPRGSGQWSVRVARSVAARTGSCRLKLNMIFKAGSVMDNFPSQLVAETFGLALEGLTFVSLLPHVGRPPAPHQAMLLRLRLAQRDQFVLELVAGRMFGRLVAARLRGTSPDDPRVQSHEINALKKLMNVTGRAILGLTLPYDAEPLEMSMLKVEPLAAAAEWQEFIKSPQTRVFDAEGNTIALQMREIA